MSQCCFCNLLCELPEEVSQSKNEDLTPAKTAIDCHLRNESLTQVALRLSQKDARHPRIDGCPVSMAQAIKAAKELLIAKHEAVLLVTGDIRTVETSRAVLAFALENNAILDPFGSDPAFAQILATQRGGMLSASLSEVRFRSDCIVVVGTDDLIRSMPRLPHLLARPHQQDLHETATRIVLIGRWSAESINLFRSLDFEVQAIQMDPCDFPKAIRDWSKLSSEERSQSSSLPSRWIESAKYLTIVWAPNNLHFVASDLWIERVQGWITEQNANRRVVGLSLAGAYQTFQQVATWTTGFPGRMRLESASDGELAVDYQPNRFRAESIASLSPRPVVIQVDDTALKATNSISIDADILIAPSWLPHSEVANSKEQKAAPKIFLPSILPGIEAASQFFRADSVYSVKIGPNEPAVGSAVNSSGADLLQAISPGATL
jgi:formylmethanofuran dehydrogenase subunit B